MGASRTCESEYQKAACLTQPLQPTAPRDHERCGSVAGVRRAENIGETARGQNRRGPGCHITWSVYCVARLARLVHPARGPGEPLRQLRRGSGIAAPRLVADDAATVRDRDSRMARARHEPLLGQLPLRSKRAFRNRDRASPASARNHSNRPGPVVCKSASTRSRRGATGERRFRVLLRVAMS